MAVDPKEPIDEEIDEEGLEEGHAGLDDDESGHEAEAGQELEADEAEEGLVDAQPSRATRRVQEATRTAREAAARAQALEVEVAQLRAEHQAREAQAAQPKGESPEQEAARLALMTVDERVEYRLNKAEQRHQHEMNVTRFVSADQADKSQYAAKAASNPRYKKYEAEVESVLADARRGGQNFSREQILAFVLGQKVLNGGGAVSAAKKAGATRVQAQRATADSGRSDRSAPRQREGSGNSIRDLERRLDGVHI